MKKLKMFKKITEMIFIKDKPHAHCCIHYIPSKKEKKIGMDIRKVHIEELCNENPCKEIEQGLKEYKKTGGIPAKNLIEKYKNKSK